MIVSPTFKKPLFYLWYFIYGHIRTLSSEQRMESDQELDETSKIVCRSSAVVTNVSPTVSTAQQTISSNASSQVDVQTG